MRLFQDIAAGIFLGAIALLSAVSILGVWDVFGTDVIEKSFMTLGLLALIAVIVIIAGQFIHTTEAEVAAAPAPTEGFKLVRRVTIGVLITASVIFALTGVMAIWEVIEDMDVLYKVLSSVGILAFGAFMTVMTCLEREGYFGTGGKTVSVGALVVLLIVGWILLSIMSAF